MSLYDTHSAESNIELTESVQEDELDKKSEIKIYTQ
jgi:hypothetical protein